MGRCISAGNDTYQMGFLANKEDKVETQAVQEVCLFYLCLFNKHHYFFKAERNYACYGTQQGVERHSNAASDEKW